MSLKVAVVAACSAVLFIAAVSFSTQAQTAASDNLSGPLTAAQSLGARTRAEIARLGIHNADTNRALELQRDGDQALRDRDPVKAAEDYGRAEEAVSVLARERVSAREARAKTDAALQRAKSAGTDIASAERLGASGDQALATGNYHTAEVDYAQARAQLNRTATR